MTINEINHMIKVNFFNESPFDTGQLRESASDPGRMINGVVLPGKQVGFMLFGKHGQGYYGAILNEAEKIRVRVRNTSTGGVSYRDYSNRHYKYVDNFFERQANLLPLLIPGLRRVL